jgi:hypothetical protein
MKTFDIWYAGQIIDNVNARNQKEAETKASAKWSTGKRGTVVVCEERAPEEVYKAAQAASQVVPA